jgi:hypothetical protein
MVRRSGTISAASAIGLVKSKEPFTDFDEFWLGGYEYVNEPMRRNPGNDRHFRILDLKELLELFAPPWRGGTTSKAKTKIGKAVEANEKEILLAVVGLILQIDAKIEALRGQRPNSDEAIAERDAHISPNTRGCVASSNTFRRWSWHSERASVVRQLLYPLGLLAAGYEIIAHALFGE